MGRRTIERRTFHSRCIVGNPYSISEDQSSEGRACSTVHGLESTNADSKSLSI